MGIGSSPPATLAAREKRAICRLRDCSRQIERIAAAAIPAKPDPAAETTTRRVRSFTTEAARIRVELRRWDTASPGWIERLDARLDDLADELETVASVGLHADAHRQVLVAPHRVPRRWRSEDHVERSVYEYLYPRAISTAS